MLLLGVLQAQAAGAVAEGDFVLLDQRVLTSAESSVTFSSLSTYAADYQHLQIRAVANKGVNNINNITIKANGLALSRSHILRGFSGSVGSFAATVGELNIAGSGDVYTAFVMDILDPFETTKNTTMRTLVGSNSVTEPFIALYSHLFNNTAALTSIEFDSGSWVAGSRFSLYGIKAGS